MVVEDLGRKRRGRFGRILGMLLVLVLVIAAGWTWFSLSWSYSEGELAQYVVGGVAPQIWFFSTRDEKLAQQLAGAVGNQIRLHYTEHRGVPTSCFAETPYFAESFTRVER
jgi:hypothetical protein